MTDWLCKWNRFLRTAAVLLCLTGCLTACGSDAVSMEYDAETGLPAVRTTVSAEPVPEQAPSVIPETEAETLPPGTEAETVPPETEAETVPPETEAETLPPETEAETLPLETEAETLPPGTEAETLPPETEAENVPPETEAETLPPETEAENVPPETEAETVPPETEAETTLPAVVPAEVTFVLNTNTMRYHRTDCSSVAKIQPQNLAYHYGAAEELTAYTPCGVCLKDIAEPVPPVTEPVPGGSAFDYVLNRNTMKFHYPSCGSVEKIKPENYGTYSGSRDELTAQGYKPCGNCDP